MNNKGYGKGLKFVEIGCWGDERFVKHVKASLILCMATMALSQPVGEPINDVLNTLLDTRL